MNTTPTSPTERFVKEIHRLHDFFVAWFTAAVENTAEQFASADQAMGAKFCLIGPQGTCTHREELVQALQQAYGCRKGQVFEIECRNVQVLQHVGNTYLVSYEEWQRMGDDVETARLSSAWFQDFQNNHSDINNNNDRFPNGLQWLHVHETWMPGKGPPSVQHMWTPPATNDNDDATTHENDKEETATTTHM